MANAKRLDPSLLPKGKPNEEPKLYQFSVGEMRVQPLPKGVIRDGVVPDDGAGIRQRGFFAITELN